MCTTYCIAHAYTRRFKILFIWLNECVAAGEPLNPEIIDAWKKGTGLILRDGYGQTESTCLIANLPGVQIEIWLNGETNFFI